MGPRACEFIFTTNVVNSFELIHPVSLVNHFKSVKPTLHHLMESGTVHIIRRISTHLHKGAFFP